MRRYLVASGLAAALYAASAFVPAPWRFVLWAVAVAVMMANSPLAYYRLPDLPTQVSHMPERFGLFTIIVLGEAVVGVAEAVSETPHTPPVLAVSALGFALGAALWWLYFIREDPSALSTALAGGRATLLRSHVYGYSHYLVYAGIVAASVGAEEAILAVGGEHAFPPAARVALAGGVGLAVLGMAVVHRAAAQGLPTAVFGVRLTVAAGLAALAASGAGPGPALIATASAAGAAGRLGDGPAAAPVVVAQRGRRLSAQLAGVASRADRRPPGTPKRPGRQEEPRCWPYLAATAVQA